MERDPSDQAREIEALRKAMLRAWWWVCLALWLTVGVASLWALRAEFQELRTYFTWTALRFMFISERLAGLGLGLCYGLTLALLCAESRHILWGLSNSEEVRLRIQLNKIHEQGPSHPQWKIIQPENARSRK